MWGGKVSDKPYLNFFIFLDKKAVFKKMDYCIWFFGASYEKKGIIFIFKGRDVMELNIPENFKRDIDIAVEILRNEGCIAIYLFGSLVTGNIHEKSDIDIGIMGLPPRKFFRVYAKLDDKVNNNIDLVDFDTQDKFYELLDSLGEVVKIG